MIDTETKQEVIKMFEDMSSSVQMIVGDRHYSRDELLDALRNETEVGMKILNIHQAYKDAMKDA